MTPVATARPFHAVHFYDGDADLLPALSGYVSAGLFEDCVIVVATPEHRTALNDRLDHAWTESARADGRYVELDAAQTLSLFMRDGWPDPHLFRAVLGTAVREKLATCPRARGYGELSALLVTAGQRDAALAVEDLCNELQQQYVFPILCAYPRRDFGGADSAAYRQTSERHTQLLMAG